MHLVKTALEGTNSVGSKSKRRLGCKAIRRSLKSLMSLGFEDLLCEIPSPAIGKHSHCMRHWHNLTMYTIYSSFYLHSKDAD